MSEVAITPKCPKCNGDILYDERVSTDFDDAYCFINWIAHCEQCQRTFALAEDYKIVERRIYNAEDDG